MRRLNFNLIHSFAYVHQYQLKARAHASRLIDVELIDRKMFAHNSAYFNMIEISNISVNLLTEVFIKYELN